MEREREGERDREKMKWREIEREKDREGQKEKESSKLCGCRFSNNLQHFGASNHQNQVKLWKVNEKRRGGGGELLKFSVLI